MWHLWGRDDEISGDFKVIGVDVGRGKPSIAKGC